MMDEVAEQGEGFAAYCRKGKGWKRVEMEDRHVAAVALGGDRAQAMFGVFDGHGGKSAAEFAAENMPRIMAEELKRGRGVEEAVRRAYLRTDEEFSSSTADAEGPSGGACCVTALLREDNGWGTQLAVKLKMLVAPPWQRVRKGSVLTMKLRGEVTDQLKTRFSSGLSLPQICENFEKAAYDPRISGIYLHIEPLSCGWGKVGERILPCFCMR